MEVIIMKFISKILSALLSGTILLADIVAFPITTFAENIRSCGLLPDTSDSIYEEDDYYSNTAKMRSTLPQSVDLSMSPCFPPLGADQGNTQACVGFATTYYQYSYEVNRLNQVTNENNRVIYSPKWTYNLTNNGYDSGTSFDLAYNLLTTMGALKYEDYPFDGIYDEWPAGMEEEKREAVNISCDVHKVELSSENGSVSSNNLKKIKLILNNGHVLTVGMQFLFAHNKPEFQNPNGDICYYEFPNTGAGHACVVVGYDDNIQCDINGDGVIENAEKGAFKVVNSFGLDNDYDKNGYFWVMYDALNYQSSVSNFENATNRICAFRRDASSSNNSAGTYVNTFRYINVSYDNLNIIAKLRVQTHNMDDIHMKYYPNEDTNNPVIITNPSRISRLNEVNNYFDGTFFFNFSKYDDDVASCVDELTWLVRTHDLLSNDSYTYVITTLKLLDNMDNVIANSAPTFENQQEIDSFYEIGDVNYDHTLTAADAELMLNFLVGNQTESHIQHYLGDFNQDGKFTIIDVTELNQYLGNTGSATADEIKKINQQIANCLQYSQITDTITQEEETAVLQTISNE